MTRDHCEKCGKLRFLMLCYWQRDGQDFKAALCRSCWQAVKLALNL
jgi:hypothetical protein